MKTNKKAIGSFLAVVMLLVVSIATASAYTVRPALNNNVDVGEQMVAEEAEQIIVSTTKGDDAHIYGTVSERYLEPWGDWWSRPFPGVTIMARSPGVHKEVITDENGLYELYLSPGTYLLSAYKVGYLVVFPLGHWRFGEWINASYKRTWGAGDSAHYAFSLVDKDEMEPEEIPTINPASLIFWGKATLDIHAEVLVQYCAPQRRYPVNGGFVRAVPIIFPLWLRLILTVEGITDSEGNCQLQVKAPPKWSPIPLSYRVWVTDPGYDKTGCSRTDFDVHAGRSYNLHVDVIISRDPWNR